jgi:hypothetical protein
MIPHIDRYKLVDSIRKIINFTSRNMRLESEEAFNEIHAILESHKDLSELSNGMLVNLIGDDSNQGQIKLAKDTMYFYRWGQFYLDQLSRSLNQQIKPNFKDTACPFGGEIFINIVDKSSDIFDNLPPPNPSGQPVQMSVYNNTNNGCFMGDSKVLMSDNTFKSIISLLPGDEIYTLSDHNNANGQQQTAKVIALVKIISTNGMKNISCVDKLRLTPWHPILYNNEWGFPNNFNSKENSKEIVCDAVYNVVLTNGHTINVNNIWAVTLGHEFQNGILKHDYFGTKKIVKDLMNTPGWNNGHVVIYDNQFIRGNVSNQVVGITITKDKDIGLLSYELYG